MAPDKDNGIAKIVLQCQTINAEVLSFGQETAQIDLKTYEGHPASTRKALHIVDGQRGVYVKYGNLQRFFENPRRCMRTTATSSSRKTARSGTDNEVRLYDEIIVQELQILQDGKLL